MSKRPIAFLSYVRADDEHEGGRLTQFREILSREVRMQTGEEFPIFQDRNDVSWGESWQTTIEESLDTVTFLIPVITPGFFRSQACRDELSRFLRREKLLGCTDLVLPLYYVNCPISDDPKKRGADRLAQAIHARQYEDWRELRFEALTSPLTRRKIADLAMQIRDPLEAPETETPTVIVDQLGRGDFSTIADAIRAARPSSRILIKPGLYTEALVIDKPMELLGDGARDEVIIQTTDADVVLFRTSTGRLTDLSLRQLGGSFYAAEIEQGRLLLEE